MQDAAQYGAVESSSPSPPKRFGRKTVVALAALGLAGVAALSLGPQKKGAMGLVARPAPPPRVGPASCPKTGNTGESRGSSDYRCMFTDMWCPCWCASNRNNHITNLCCRCKYVPPPPGPDCTRRSPMGGFLEDCPTLCQPWRSSVNAPYTKECADAASIRPATPSTRRFLHAGCTCPNCNRQSPIGGGLEDCPQLCAGNLITSRFAKECCRCAQ